MIDDHELDAAFGALAEHEDRESRHRTSAVWNGMVRARQQQARRRRWTRLGIAIAATLVIGFGLGRWSGTPQAPVDAPRVAAGVAPPEWSPMRADLRARSRGLLREVGAVDSPPTQEWQALAGELLWATRRLLDDPATREVADRQVLTDLEAVLAQIIDIDSADAEFELRLVRESIVSTRLLGRLAPTQGEAL